MDKKDIDSLDVTELLDRLFVRTKLLVLAGLFKTPNQTNIKTLTEDVKNLQEAIKAKCIHE